ncbi:MAG: putative ABC transporter permease [Clostridia bacterium]|nr:putative ABC transporter permease [Clostridia bacterium]
MRVFWLFVAYSFLGFLLETGFAALRTGRLINRKTMLVLPLCPVYGLGGAALVLLSEHLPLPPVAFAVAGGLACTAIEYGYSLACELLFRVRLWDYGDGRGSVHGRIHLLFCLYWGALALAVTAWVQPAVQRAVSALPVAWFPWAAAIVLADASATAALLYRFGRKGGRMPGCPVARRMREMENGEWKMEN